METHVPWITKPKEKLEKNVKANKCTWSNAIWDERESTLGVPKTQSRIWSQAALAANNALDAFWALIMAKPRCCMVLMNSVFNLWQAIFFFWKKKDSFWRPYKGLQPKIKTCTQLYPPRQPKTLEFNNFSISKPSPNKTQEKFKCMCVYIPTP